MQNPNSPIKSNQTSDPSFRLATNRPNLKPSPYTPDHPATKESLQNALIEARYGSCLSSQGKERL